MTDNDPQMDTHMDPYTDPRTYPRTDTEQHSDSTEEFQTHDANKRVAEAAKRRWDSIRKNPKIMLIALFASYDGQPPFCLPSAIPDLTNTSVH